MNNSNLSISAGDNVNNLIPTVSGDILHIDDGNDLSTSYENEYAHAKSLLQNCSEFTGDNLYDHLSDVLSKILDERPRNIVDFFEEYSRQVKKTRFRPLTDHLQDVYRTPIRHNAAQKNIGLFKPSQTKQPSTVHPEDIEVANLDNIHMLELHFYGEQAGLVLPRTEMYTMELSIRKFVEQEPVISVRYWGKIYGLNANYTILETELNQDEYIRMNQDLEEAQESSQQPLGSEDRQQMGGADDDLLAGILLGEDEQPSREWLVFPPVPISTYEKPPEAPPEMAGVGANKKVYYVCNQVGEAWIRLPNVTPKQIRTARQICTALTGDLIQPMDSYPAFPGNEANYLRAQIARISASTQIAPLGYYTFEDGGEGGEDVMDEEEPIASGDEIRENPKYERPALSDLIDPSMSFWVHCEQYLLPQGRTSWWNPGGLPEDLGEEEEDEEERRSLGVGAQVEPETGPNLLTPCSDDVTLDGVPPWTVLPTQNATNENRTVILVRSNIWPGAYAFTGNGKLYHNLYHGNGLKQLPDGFSPVPLPPIQQEWPQGPEIMEITDPTGAEEEAWRIAHLPKPVIETLGGEALEGEQLEEEDEDDEDDEDDD